MRQSEMEGLHLSRFLLRHTALSFIALVLSLQRLEHRLLSVDVIWDQLEMSSQLVK